MARKGRLASLVRALALATTVAAVVQELRLSPDKRTWHGRVGGIVPYDFRVPTIERARGSWWNPDDERILTEQVFGVGWTLNFGRIVHLLRSR